MLVDNKYHLTYCTNIHSGKSWEDFFISFKPLITEIKDIISPDSPFGIGLRLSDYASKELLEEKNLFKFKKWLEENGLYVFTINGFPYGIFHQKIVKDDVHKPDWSTIERVEYTKRLCRILSVLLPKGIEGGISTSPLSYKPWFEEDQKRIKIILKNSAIHLAMIAEEMNHIRRESGKIIHLDLEPEPDGLIENSLEVVKFFKEELFNSGADYLCKKSGISSETAEEILRTHIRVCYDICHFAIAYEDHESCFDLFEREGIKIGKVQISSALQTCFTDDEKENNYLLSELEKFNDKVYLHQVVEKEPNNKITQYRDLSIALENKSNIKSKEWRTHFHVPVFCDHFGKLKSTQEDVKKVLDLIKENNFSGHLEVETYTWEVLPAGLKENIQSSIIRELEWVIQQMQISISANE